MSNQKNTAVQERFSKTQMIGELSESTGLARKDVANVLDELSILIQRHMKKRAVGEFVLPGLLKIVKVKKPARKARKNVPNPFKPGELMDVAAKAATTAIKIRPLKKLKDFAAN